MNSYFFKSFLLPVCVLFFSGTTKKSVDAEPQFSIITEALNDGGPAHHGLEVLMVSLQKKGITYEHINSIEKAKGRYLLVAGLSSQPIVSKITKDFKKSSPTKPESLSVWKATLRGKPLLTVSGSDERGLMYTLLDVTDRISSTSDTSDPFSKIVPGNETPEVVTRAISLYTMNRAYWESRFYDEKYWTRYMDMLATNRFNSMVVIFGYENAGFLAPCYPYFFDVDGYPNIKMDKMTPAQQAKNLAALNRIIDIAHERGIEFKVGIWDHIYRGGVQAGGLSQKELAENDKGHLVLGVTAENLSEYTKVALVKFLQKVPHLDGIQFRMHNESGLQAGGEMDAFWREMFAKISETAPNFKFDLRAKDLPESIIQVAIDQKLNFRITTKYWMEQMGLPFHPTHINTENQFDRRHGYADMLQYPPKYKMHWRMFSGGTQRILLWGSPEYTKRFVASTHLYNGEGFEVNEPLATKMEAQPHNMTPFNILNPGYVYYDYEFERYWHFFQTFGRLGYNLNTPSEVWDSEFEKRFGQEAGPVVEAALHKASWVLPMIVGACSPYGTFPTTRGWPEKQRYGDLPAYAEAAGSDIQQFASFDEEAKLLIEKGETAKRLPSATSLWFEEMNRDLNKMISKIEGFDLKGNKELRSTLTDLKILSNLALFHSRRIPAAVSYRIYMQTKDPFALDDAIMYERQAAAAWEKIVIAAGDVYADDLRFGVRETSYMGIVHKQSGNWKEEHIDLLKGLEKLQQQRSTLQNSTSRTSPVFKPRTVVKTSFHVKLEGADRLPVGKPLNVRATVNSPAGVKWVRLRYRSVNQHQDYQTLPMQKTSSNVYEATVPAGKIDPKFDFMYFVEVMDNNGNGWIFPDLDVEDPYKVVTLER